MRSTRRSAVAVSAAWGASARPRRWARWLRAVRMCGWSGFTAAARVAAAGGQDIGVQAWLVVEQGLGEGVEVVAGGADLPGFSQAAAHAEEDRVCPGPAQRVACVADERGGVGAQDLGEDGVPFDAGPCRGEGVRGGAHK